MLAITNLHFDYGDKPLLTDINFKLHKSELIQIHGDNGAGKTTLLKIIAGLIMPDIGSVNYQNYSIRHTHNKYNCCYLGHKLGVNQALSAREHYKFELAHSSHTLPLEDALESLNLAKVAHLRVMQLSFGQRRRVALLRLAYSIAPLWLLDEPFVGLDAAGTEWLTLRLRQHLSMNGLVVLTSHQKLPEDLATCLEYRLC